MSKREKVLLAVLGSILVHGLILAVLAIFVQLRPATALASRTQPIRLEIQEEPTPTPTPALAALPNVLPKTTPPIIDTPERARTDEEPENPVAQSDKNTLAASEEAATGDAPVPSQQGKKIARFEFDTQPYTLGDKPAQASAAQPQQQPPPPQPKTPPQTTPPRPQVNRDVARSTPAPTPTPEPSVAPEEFAMNGPTPTPAPTPEEASPTPKPEETPSLDFTVRQTTPPRPRPLLPPSDPRRSAAPGYQPQTAKTLMSGGLTNHGPSSIAAKGTPLGRYQKAIADAIGSRWYFYVNKDLADMPTIGSVTIHFTLDRFGKVRTPHVVTQSGSSTLAGFSLQAIIDADLPPMPPDVFAVVNRNEIEMDFSFTLE